MFCRSRRHKELLEMKFYGLVNTVKVMSNCSVNLLILFLGSLLSSPIWPSRLGVAVPSLLSGIRLMTGTHVFVSLRVYNYIS